MRMTPLITAAVLVSSAASAQQYGADCRGGTVGELARCAAQQAPAPVEAPAPGEVPMPQANEAAPMTPQRLQPTRLGGALQPSNQRAEPQRVGGPTNSRAADLMPTAPSGLEPLTGLTGDPASPLYQVERSNAELQRILDPLAGTRIRDR